MIAERHHGTDLSSTLARAFSAMSSNNGKRGYHCPLDHGLCEKLSRRGHWIDSPVFGPGRHEVVLGSSRCKCLKKLVGERGFEPPTPWSRTRCSTRLSHSPTVTRAATRRPSTRAILLFDGLHHYNIATWNGFLCPTDPSFALHLMTHTC
jgi:hypothetical protein